MNIKVMNHVKAINQVFNYVSHRVKDHLTDPVRIQVKDQVRFYVLDQVFNHVWDRVEIQIEDQVRDLVELKH